jgi:multiple sugar transport system substrate-binding protein
MSQGNKLSRRNFLKLTGAAAAVAATGGVAKSPVFAGPNVIRRRKKIAIGVGGWAVDSMNKIFSEMDFTSKTGIEVEVLTRSGVSNEFITEMAGAIQAKTSPYDVIDFEDEIAVTFSRAKWLKDLSDLVPAEVWSDFPQNMVDMAEVWDKYDGELFRVHHNYEACYWWYRKDWFDAKGAAVPTTWEEVAALGSVFTNEGDGVWATEDGLVAGGMMNVYLAWITLQAGGNPFEDMDAFRTGLEYIRGLVDNKTFNPASLQKNYDAINADYIADKVAFMRQWPYFYNVSRAATDWFAEDKVVVTLPPAGPVAKPLTYVAGWGWGIPKTTENPDEAAELVKWLVDTANAAQMLTVTNDVWYLSARNSVLEAAGTEGIPSYLKMYSDAGAIGVRPFHPKFVEALSVLEESASAYLTDQINLDDAIKQTSDRLGKIK